MINQTSIRYRCLALLTQWKSFLNDRGLSSLLRDSAFLIFTIGYAIVFIRLFLNIQNFYFYNLHTIDSAGFVDLLNTIVEKGEMKSSIFSSFYSLHPILTMKLEEFTSYDFTSQYSDANFFRWHAYVISYVLSLFVLVGLPATEISIFFNLVGTFGVVLIAIYFCYRHAINFFVALFLVLAFAQLLPIKDVIYGQFYFEKLFPFLMLCLCLLSYQLLSLSQRKPHQVLLFLSLTFLCASISERSALMCGMFLLVFGIGFKFRTFALHQRWLFIGGGIACFAWFVLYHLVFYDSLYSSTLSFANIEYNVSRLFSEGPFQDKTMVLLLILLPHFVLGMLSPLAGVIAFCSVLPNVFLDVAGAEKVGFSTHYHMMYLPFLIFANLLAVKEFVHSNIVQWIKFPLSTHRNSPLIILLCLTFPMFLINSSVSIDYSNSRVNYDLSKIEINHQPYVVTTTVSNKKIIEPNILHHFDEGKGLHVSASNTLMPMLVNANVEKVDAFPVSLFAVDYVLIERVETEINTGAKLLPQVQSYHNDEILEKQLWLQAKLNEDFSLVTAKQLSSGREISLYKKNE